MKKRILSIFAALVVAFSVTGAPAREIVGSVAVTADAASMVEAPKSNRESGNYTVPNAIKIILTCPTEGASIYYDTGYGYRKYTGSFNITQNTTLRMYAFKNGITSPVVTYTYSLTPNMAVVEAPDSTPANQRIVIRSNVIGIKYYYTLDGSTPTTSSAVYTAAGINITKSCTLKVLAVRPKWNTRLITKTVTVGGGTVTPPPAEGSVTQPVTEKTLLEDYTKKWGYNQLSANQRKVYERLYKAAETFSESADISDLGFTLSTADQIYNAYWAFDYDNPQFLELGNGYSSSYNSRTGQIIALHFVNRRSKSEITPVYSQFNAIAQSVLAEAKKRSTDYDKLLYIHDWIVNNTAYTLNGPAYKSEADGPIVYGKALCEGYSKAFMYLAQSLGFECICVIGGDHMWNMVKLNGTWYHVDTTFDDPLTVSGNQVLRHDYFLVSEYSIKQDHTIEHPIKIPSAPRNY